MEERCSYAIEERDGEYRFVEYFGNSRGRRDGNVLDCDTADEFISYVVSEWEMYVLEYDPVAASYDVPYDPVDTGGGWMLEVYRFNRLMTGDYSVDVQAGDRCTGSGRTFFIPPETFDAGTFDEFLDRYEEVVPGKHFGLFKEDLAGDMKLREFLGYKE